MESDHNVNNTDSTVNRNDTRTVRPRLSELLKIVKTPDEVPAYEASRASSASKSLSSVVMTSESPIPEHTAETPLSTGDSSAAAVPMMVNGGNGNSGSGNSVEWSSSNGNGAGNQSTASIAAQQRRQALYARRNNEWVSTNEQSMSSSRPSGNGLPTATNGRREKRGTRELGSLTSRLFGERNSSSPDNFGDVSDVSSDANAFTPASFTAVDTGSDSIQASSHLPPSDSLLGNSASSESEDRLVSDRPVSDWVAKYAAGAPLPSAPDLSAGTQSKVDAMENNDRSTAPQPQAHEQPMTHRFSKTSPPPSESLNSVNIKGRSDGVSIELGQGKWTGIIGALSQRLIQSTGFFRGGSVTLDVGVRPLRDEELQQVCDLAQQHGLNVTSVRSRSEQSCQVALAAGLAASLDAPDGLLAQPALSNYEKLEHFVYRGNLRSGQILRRAETIVVMGDVNPGSQIISDSDILVWGRLRGIAHAGASGDTRSVIAALLMEATQVRIADAVAILPEQEARTSITDRLAGNTSPSGIKRPELAHSIDEDIIVDVWDDSKPGGIMAFRRSLI